MYVLSADVTSGHKPFSLPGGHFFDAVIELFSLTQKASVSWRPSSRTLWETYIREMVAVTP